MKMGNRTWVQEEFKIQGNLFVNLLHVEEKWEILQLFWKK